MNSQANASVTNQLASQTTTDKKGSILHKLRRYYQYRVELEMKLWKMAVATAEDLLRPRRFELYQVYHRTMEDDHLLSQVRTARFTVQLGDFSIVNNGIDDETLSDLFERPWFEEYVQHAVDAELFGHSLVEFTPKRGPEFESLTLIPREHVRPETGEVLLDVFAEEGIPFRNSLIGKHLVEIGKPNDLGLLKVASRSIIRKEYSLGDWSRRNERYGMPFLAIKTMSRNEEEINAKANMAENLGVNGWAILDDQDDLTFHESSQPLAYQTYEAYADKVDGYISKLINGQTGTTEEQAYVGSAEVHERLLNTYTKARMRRIQYHINYCLLPFLRKHGYPIPEDAVFEYHDLRKKEAQVNPDNMDEGTSQGDDPKGGGDPKPEPPKGKLSAKKKVGTPSDDSELHLLYKGVHESCCAASGHQLNYDIDLDGIVGRAIRRVFQQKLQAGDVDAEAWEANTHALWQGLEEGTGTIATDYQNPASYELLSQLRRNVAVFATFKNHRQVKDLVDALTDDEGNVRSWEQFRPIAEGITKNYFENWLRAEYETAIGTGQMATKWQDYQANADILPMLQYVTQRDERVRDAHKALDGVTLPINDPFWDQYYPPNGWRCRCDIIQVIGPERKAELFPREDQVPPVFRHNPGKTLELFPQSHPYYANIPDKQRQNLIRGAARLLYDSYDENWKKVTFHEKTGGYLVRHNDQEVAVKLENHTLGTMLARTGEAVEMLPQGAPDLSRNGLLWATAKKRTDLADILNEVRQAARRSERVLLRTDELTPELKAALVKAKADEGIYKLQVIEGENLHNL
jgi:SPP1 gp7 family putative phage head morphogenesis protein